MIPLLSAYNSEMAMTILDVSDQFMGLLDIEARVIYANRTALSFIDSALEDVVGHYFWETPWWNYNDVHQHQIKSAIEGVRQSLKPLGMQVVHRNAQGCDHYFYFTLKPYLMGNKELAGFIAEGKDINDLVNAQETIRGQDLRYRDLFFNSSDAHLIIEGNVFIEVNEKAIEALGYSTEDDLIGLHPVKISPQYQPDGRLSVEKAEEMIAMAHRNGSHRFEWVHIKKDGTSIDVEVVLTPIRTGLKNLLFVTWRDIGERIRVQKALIEKQHMLTNLMIGISHELSTPLGNAILATSYLLDAVAHATQNALFCPESTEEIEAIKVIERNLNTTVSLLEYFKNHALGLHSDPIQDKPLHAITKNALDQK